MYTLHWKQPIFLPAMSKKLVLERETHPRTEKNKQHIVEKMSADELLEHFQIFVQKSKFIHCHKNPFVRL